MFEPQFLEVDVPEGDAIKMVSTHFHSALLTIKGKLLTCGKTENHVLGQETPTESHILRFRVVKALSERIMT